MAGLLYAAPAQAQTFQDPNIPGALAPGSYRVTVSRPAVGTDFAVNVVSNGAADDVKQINITFYTGADGGGSVAAVVPLSPAGATSGPASDPGANGVWEVTGMNTGAFNAIAANPSARVLGNATNSFTGIARLVSPGTEIGSVGVTLSSVNAPGAYLSLMNASPGVTEVTPEPGALALALPGLAPLGLVLRKRLKLKKNG